VAEKKEKDNKNEKLGRGLNCTEVGERRGGVPTFRTEKEPNKGEEKEKLVSALKGGGRTSDWGALGR